MSFIRRALQQTVRGEALSQEEMEGAMGEVMDGEATPAQIAAFLTSLRMKGETTDEIVGAVSAMRARALRMELSSRIILDTCGTGGDGCGTFNISTAAAFVCAASGVTVAKHGNRAVSSSVGSADVLEALGVRIDLEVDAVQRCVESIGIGFLFAPAHHSALRHAGAARREMGFRTLLNLLGPMTNPAGATHQLIGLFTPDLLVTVATVLGRLGACRAMVVHGSDGLDELTLAGPTHAAILEHGKVRQEMIDPRDLGLKSVPSTELIGGSADENAAIIRALLDQTSGPHRDVVILNAGAALWTAEQAPDLAQGVALARELIVTGAARAKLDALVEATNRGQTNA
jgi:anthranilate phosphoribosyltransferase